MDRNSVRLRCGLAAALAALTVAVYLPVVGFAFLNYDDDVYVVDNARVASGLSADNALWSLTAFTAGNWHPLTLLAHMLDVQLFGMNAAGHHGMNLAFHALNVLLLFWLLARTTREPWLASFVAALFAVHPVNVQTVAWISERKSLLSTAFWILALVAHAGYRTKRTRRAYLLVLALAGLALAAKPMAVTLPLTLVLLDVWPLGRRPEGEGSMILRYARELAPFLALAGACGLLTLAAQRHAEALQTVTAYSWPARLANAAVSYVWYLKTVVWPSGLAVFYPHPVTLIAPFRVAASIAVLAALCTFVVLKSGRWPALAMGWWWYAGTLLPVAGIIQVGSQAYADRYAYVPLIGIFVIVAWGGARMTATASARWRRVATASGIAGIAALAIVTRSELSYWRDSVALFQRAVDVVPDNALAHNNLGMALVARNRMSEALVHFEKAVAIAPWDTAARSNQGNALRSLGRPAEAAAAYEKALAQSPDDASIHYNLATALADLGRGDEAIGQLSEAVRLDPGHARARVLLGTLYVRQGRSADALAQFREVTRIDPSDQRAVEWVRRLEAAGAR